MVKAIAQVYLVCVISRDEKRMGRPSAMELCGVVMLMMRMVFFDGGGTNVCIAIVLE